MSHDYEIDVNKNTFEFLKQTEKTIVRLPSNTRINTTLRVWSVNGFLYFKILEIVETEGKSNVFRVEKIQK